MAALSRRYIEQGLAWRWRANAIAACIRDEDSCLVVAREGDGIVGFAAMSFDFEQAEAHLLLLAVLPSHRRRGLATRLVGWLELLARRGGIRSVRLEVRERARAAQALYRSLGFVERARLTGYYQQREDALRLEKPLAPVRDPR